MGVLTTIVNSVTLLAALPQNATNGVSLWGTLETPHLPYFLTPKTPSPSGLPPWGSRTVENTDPYAVLDPSLKARLDSPLGSARTRAIVDPNPSELPPTTNEIQSYEFTIKRGFIAPDGVNKSVILINDQFPGPLIEANWGDTIQVTVHNQITGPEEGTGLHWHGLLQRETPWFDGVPSVGQCPIAPGKSLVYEFKADLYGSSWYHSHYSAQYAGGLSGPMIIHGPTHVPYDDDLGPILLSDWYHDEYFSIVEEVMKPLPEGDPNFFTPVSDNSLINGKMNYDCTIKPDIACTPNAGISKFSFTSGRTHRLRLINTSSEAIMRFSIDNHTMVVMANDFVPIHTYPAEFVTLGVGQRTDVVVKAELPPGSSVFMRSEISGTCSLGTNNQRIALAAIFYEGADTTKTPSSNPTPIDDSRCGNDFLNKTVPFFPFPAVQNPETTETIDITFGQNKSGNYLWSMSGTSFRANYDNPILLLANSGNTSYHFDPQWNVYNTGQNKSVRIILRNRSFASHPIHFHGHNFFVLADGPEPEWDGTIADFENAQRRDVQLLQPNGHLVLQYSTDNPGVWPLHCHIAWHVSAGLYVNMMEQTDLIKKKIIPDAIRQTCRDWAHYGGRTVVEQIDSGLR